MSMPVNQDVFNEIKDMIDSPAQSQNDKAILRDCVRSVLTSYFNDMEGHTVDDLYQLVLAEVEAPLLQTVLDHTKGNQSKAAQMLGINRGTLRKKLKHYNLND
jgi:Fis family transcriptional regulator